MKKVSISSWERMAVAGKILLPFKLDLLVASLFNIVENLLLSPTTEAKSTKVKNKGRGRAGICISAHLLAGSL